jgi:hypothetical protein
LKVILDSKTKESFVGTGVGEVGGLNVLTLVGSTVDDNSVEVYIEDSDIPLLLNVDYEVLSGSVIAWDLLPGSALYTEVVLGTNIHVFYTSDNTLKILGISEGATYSSVNTVVPYDPANNIATFGEVAPYFVKTDQRQFGLNIDGIDMGQIVLPLMGPSTGTEVAEETQVEIQHKLAALSLKDIFFYYVSDIGPNAITTFTDVRFPALFTQDHYVNHVISERIMTRLKKRVTDFYFKTFDAEVQRKISEFTPPVGGATFPVFQTLFTNISSVVPGFNKSFTSAWNNVTRSADIIFIKRFLELSYGGFVTLMPSSLNPALFMDTLKPILRAAMIDAIVSIKDDIANVAQAEAEFGDFVDSAVLLTLTPVKSLFDSKYFYDATCVYDLENSAFEICSPTQGRKSSVEVAVGANDDVSVHLGIDTSDGVAKQDSYTGSDVGLVMGNKYLDLDYLVLDDSSVTVTVQGSSSVFYLGEDYSIISGTRVSWEMLPQSKLNVEVVLGSIVEVSTTLTGQGLGNVDFVHIVRADEIADIIKEKNGFVANTFMVPSWVSVTSSFLHYLYPHRHYVTSEMPFSAPVQVLTNSLNVGESNTLEVKEVEGNPAQTIGFTLGVTRGSEGEEAFLGAFDKAGKPEGLSDKAFVFAFVAVLVLPGGSGLQTEWNSFATVLGLPKWE